MINNEDPYKNSGLKLRFPNYNSIIIENITFSHKEKALFKDLYIDIPKGKLTLFYGDNGVGKTTLLKIIKRLYHPCSGRITMNNINIRDICYDEYKKKVIMMNNNDSLIEGSIEENVTMGEDFTREHINYILDICGVSKFAERFKYGIKTKVGLRYTMLSAGEKRKVSLARVLIRTPNVLLLDEPTSHLTSVDKISIISVIRKYQQDNQTTVIACSHDESFPSVSDVIIDLNNCNT